MAEASIMLTAILGSFLLGIVIGFFIGLYTSDLDESIDLDKPKSNNKKRK